MGNIYVDMSIGFGFILFCMLMTIVWILFRNLKKRLLPAMAKQEDTIPPDILEEEKRQRWREGIIWPVSLETEGRIMKAQTRDLGAGGAFIVCYSPLPPGTRFSLTIEPPGRSHVTLLSEVIWSNVNVPDDRIIHRGMGIRFIQNCAKERARLQAAISDYHEENGHPEIKTGRPAHTGGTLLPLVT